MDVAFRIGVVGLIHDHIWGVMRHFAEDARARLVAVADPNQPLLDRAVREYNLERSYTCYQQMLESEKLDAVLVYTDNASGADVVAAAAAKGVHAMVEKPMAATLEQADRMLIASRHHQTKLMVNWPTTWSPVFAHAVRLAENGEIGDLFKVRYRAAHEGPKELGCSPYFYEWLYDKRRNGAGALMDYCCYGANFCAHLLGRPGSVAGIAGRFVKRDIHVDDNAIILAKYTEAIGICEASWTQHGFGYELMINGSSGSLLANGQGLWMANAGQKNPVRLDVPALPEGHRNPADFFLSHLAADKAIVGLSSGETARNAQEILEAGVIAAESGTSIPLPLASRR